MSNWNKVVSAAKKSGKAMKKQTGGLRPMKGAPAGAAFKVASRIKDAKRTARAPKVSEGAIRKK